MIEVDCAESATQLLHRLTSDVPGGTGLADDPRLLQGFQANDPARRPQFVKRYSTALPRILLPRDLPATSLPALAVLSGEARRTPTPVDLEGLGRLLHLSAGVVRTARLAHGTHLFRAAGSGGGRFPLELYVAVPDSCPDLPAGVHWYDPVAHALVGIGPTPGPNGAAVPTLVVTGIPWRTGWRYRERGFRHVYWDAGTMLSQFLALADSAGYGPRLYTRFPDADVAELVGADQVSEWPVALVALGDQGPSVVAGGPSASGVLDADGIEFPLVTAAQRAGDALELGQSWPTAAPAKVPVVESPLLDEVILRRGSQRRMDPDRALASETLLACMAVALRGINIEHWVAVHRVTGVATGVYQWPDFDQPVRSVRRARLREQTRRACMGQLLAHDAAFVVMAITDVSQLTDREYREAQLAAGLAEGRLHLAAYALGAGASGMTFLDSRVPALLVGAKKSAELEGREGLLFTCVGAPGNTTRPGGPPGRPQEIRLVTPRH